MAFSLHQLGVYIYSASHRPVLLLPDPLKLVHMQFGPATVLQKSGMATVNCKMVLHDHSYGQSIGSKGTISIKTAATAEAFSGQAAAATAAVVGKIAEAVLSVSVTAAVRCFSCWLLLTASVCTQHL